MRKIDNSCKLVVNKLFALVSILLLASSFNAFADDDDGVMYGEPVFTETFGQGWGVWGSFEEAGLSPLAQASYTYYGMDNLAQSSSVRGNNNSSCWQFDYFDCTITNSIDFLRSIYPNAHKSWLLANFRDHTGDYDGRMFVADGAQRPGSVFERTVTELCKNAKFEFSAWVAFIHSNNNNPPNFQLEIWTKNPNLGLEAAMSRMSDYNKAQFMGNLTVGNKFASSEGGSAELLAVLPYEPSGDPAVSAGTLRADSNMWIYETGTTANPEMHRYLVYYSPNNGKYYCSEDGGVFYEAIKNTNRSSYQNTEMFRRGAMTDLGGVTTSYYVVDDDGVRRPVYAMSSCYADGANNPEGATYLYYFIDKKGAKLRIPYLRSCALLDGNNKKYGRPAYGPATYPAYKYKDYTCEPADDAYKLSDLTIEPNPINSWSPTEMDYNVYPAQEVMKSNVKLLRDYGDGTKLYAYLVETPGTVAYRTSDWQEVKSTYSHQIFYIYEKTVTKPVEKCVGCRRHGRWYDCCYTEPTTETVTEYYNAQLEIPYVNRVGWTGQSAAATGLTPYFDYEGDVTTPARWEKMKTHFTLGDQDHVYLVLRNFDTDPNGNDFAVDDIEFRPFSQYALTIDLSNSSIQTACSAGMVTMISTIDVEDFAKAEIEAALKDFGFYFEGYNGEKWVSINSTPIQVQSVDDAIELNMSVSEYNSYEKIRAVVRSSVNTNGKCKTLGSKEFLHKDLGDTPLFKVTGDDICVDDETTETAQLKGKFKITNTNNTEHKDWRAKVRLSDGSIVNLSAGGCD